MKKSVFSLQEQGKIAFDNIYRPLTLTKCIMHYIHINKINSIIF